MDLNELMEASRRFSRECVINKAEGDKMLEELLEDVGATVQPTSSVPQALCGFEGERSGVEPEIPEASIGDDSADEQIGDAMAAMRRQREEGSSDDEKSLPPTKRYHVAEEENENVVSCSSRTPSSSSSSEPEVVLDALEPAPDSAFPPLKRHAVKDVDDHVIWRVTGDVDSFVAIGSSPRLFNVDDRFDLSVKRNNFRPCDQKKAIAQIDPQDTSKWFTFRLGGYYKNSILVLCQMSKPIVVPVKKAPAEFLEKVLRKAIASGLSSQSRSRKTGKVDNFTFGDDKGQPIIFKEDWPEFCVSLDLLLNQGNDGPVDRWRRKFGVQRIYFMRFVHGLQVSVDNRLPCVMDYLRDEANVNLNSDACVLLQLHIGNTLIPRRDVALVVDHKAGRGLFGRSVNFLPYKKFFFTNRGGFTTNL